LGQSFPLADNKSSVTPRESDLHSSVKSVLVRGQSNRLIADSKQLALLTFTVDLTQNFNPDGYRSLVLNPHGQVIASSQHNIAPRAGFFGNPDEGQSSSGRKPDDKIFGPVANTEVYVDEWVYPGGVDVTDENGRYNLKFNLPPCPGFSFEYATDVWADLTYQNFNPMGTSTLPFYLRRQDWDFCSGYLASVPTNSLSGAMAHVALIGIYASAAIPIYNVDLTVDVMMLTGNLVLMNPDSSPIEVGAVTEYGLFDLSTQNDAANQSWYDDQGNLQSADNWYDFDGDGAADPVVLGKMIEEQQADGSQKKVFY